ncbi:MAG: UbiA family prenyltransferase [Chthoniobacter sp.]|nr:UbiA family prenyltransferase [Chthoniobacter sp.]
MLTTLRTWLQLVRAPNLFTVPGDPLAGYVLVAYGAFGPEVYYAVGASLCLYAAGLLDNDLADLAEDRAERPGRPLPSGAASPRTVALAALGLGAGGLALAGMLGGTALGIAVALVLAVALYNHRTKHVPVLGALNMGACRGLSLLLGAAAAPHPELLWRLLAAGRANPLLTAALLVTLYIAAVTHLARFETKAQQPPLAKWLPGLVLLAGAVLFILQVKSGTVYSTAAILAVAVLNGFGSAGQLASDPNAPVPPVIGQFIRLLLLVQAGLCAAVGMPEPSLPGAAVPLIGAALLVMAWPISRAVSKRFYAS